MVISLNYQKWDHISEPLFPCFSIQPLLSRRVQGGVTYGGGVTPGTRPTTILINCVFSIIFVSMASSVLKCYIARKQSSGKV